MKNVEWVEINLPYMTFPEDQESPVPTPPDLSAEEQELFGTTADKIWELCNPNLRIAIWRGVYIEDWEDPETEARRRFLEKDPEAARYWEMLARINAWKHNHPAMIAWQKAFHDSQNLNTTNTFKGQGLAVPGTQIEIVDDEGVHHKYLIGHINPDTGVCGDCAAFQETALVTRYRVLVTPEEME